MLNSRPLAHVSCTYQKLIGLVMKLPGKKSSIYVVVARRSVRLPAIEAIEGRRLPASAQGPCTRAIAGRRPPPQSRTQAVPASKLCLPRRGHRASSSIKLNSTHAVPKQPRRGSSIKLTAANAGRPVLLRPSVSFFVAYSLNARGLPRWETSRLRCATPSTPSTCARRAPCTPAVNGTNGPCAGSSSSARSRHSTPAKTSLRLIERSVLFV